VIRSGSELAPFRASPVQGPGDLRDLHGQERHSVGVRGPATATRAASKRAGNFLFRFFALRRIPAQARGVKKYCCGTTPVSKISDKEDATPSLGHSVIFRVQDPVGPPVPEFCQRPEDGAKRPSSGLTEDPGYIFPEDPLRPKSVSKSHELQAEVATVTIQSFSETGDAEVLARGASDQEIDSSLVGGEGVSELGEVAIQGHLGVVVGEVLAWEFFNFAEKDWFPIQGMPRLGGAFNSTAHRAVPERHGELRV
jgi:hypothetical protein